MAARLRQRAARASALRRCGRTAAQRRCSVARAERGASHMRFGRIKSVTRGHTRTPPTRWVLSLALVCVVPACRTGWRAAEGGFGGTGLAAWPRSGARLHVDTSRRRSAGMRRCGASRPCRHVSAVRRRARAEHRCSAGPAVVATAAAMGLAPAADGEEFGTGRRRRSDVRHAGTCPLQRSGSWERGVRELLCLVTWRRRRDLATGFDTHALPNALHRCSMVAECGADAPAPEPAVSALTELPVALVRRIVEVRRRAVSRPRLRRASAWLTRARGGSAATSRRRAR